MSVDLTNDVLIEKDGKVTLCIIKNFSDNLKNYIKNSLTVVCYGPSVNNFNDRQSFPFNQTIASFKERYEKKTDILKMGMLGELLAHVLINYFMKELQVFSPYFNKEEATIRKSFDILYFDKNFQCVRYGEVKSGKKHENKDISETANTLLGAAESDLRKNKFQANSRQVLWDNAKNDAMLYYLYDNTINLIDLLKNDRCSKTSTDKKVILVSVCFHNVDDKIKLERLKNFYFNRSSAHAFQDMIIFSIQKDSLKDLENFMIKECCE